MQRCFLGWRCVPHCSFHPLKRSCITVRTASGPVTYSLEVPPGTPVGTAIKPDPQVAYSANFPTTAGSAEVAAVGWAGGLEDKVKFYNYPNSLTILGGKVPGGFYNASLPKP